MGRILDRSDAITGQALSGLILADQQKCSVNPQKIG
jgi:hypothetical protein